MNINGVEIVDTFAEAFGMTAARVLVTAASIRWARIAAQTMTGYATSVIGCDAEAGVESEIHPKDSPDGRPCVSVLLFAFSRDALQKAVLNRTAQCVLTCPTTACYNGLAKGEKTITIGGALRYFGDGFQISKKLLDRRFWRIPVMDGEFTCEDVFGTIKGVAGGNLLIIARSAELGLEAAEKAVDAIAKIPGAITPFPGGVVRSGSKVGSKYKALKASTNHSYAPTLRGLVESELPADAECVYEIVIDGLDLASVEKATAVGVRAACSQGVLQISAGNYGGKLGPYHIRLFDVLQKFGDEKS